MEHNQGRDGTQETRRQLLNGCIDPGLAAMLYGDDKLFFIGKKIKMAESK